MTYWQNNLAAKKRQFTYLWTCQPFLSSSWISKPSASVTVLVLNSQVRPVHSAYNAISAVKQKAAQSVSSQYIAFPVP